MSWSSFCILYKVSGDFSLMINWNQFFGNAAGCEEKKDSSEKSVLGAKVKPPVMLTMLTAWITFWVAVSMDPQVGALYIIAAAWGVLYICIAIWTFFLTGVFAPTILVIINQVMPVIMGVFTVWFQKWYPAKMAGM